MSPAPRRVWLPWLLLLVPTLLIGGVALRLLWLEQQRIDAAEAEAVARTAAATRERAQVAADNIELLVAEIRDGVLRELAETPPTNLEALLANWPHTNPLVAQTFLWKPNGGGLAWPPADSAEHIAFRTRHAELFRGSVARLAAQSEQESRTQSMLVAGTTKPMETPQVAFVAPSPMPNDDGAAQAEASADQDRSVASAPPIAAAAPAREEYKTQLPEPVALRPSELPAQEADTFSQVALNTQVVQTRTLRQDVQQATKTSANLARNSLAPVSAKKERAYASSSYAPASAAKAAPPPFAASAAPTVEQRARKATEESEVFKGKAEAERRAMQLDGVAAAAKPQAEEASLRSDAVGLAGAKPVALPAAPTAAADKADPRIVETVAAPAETDTEPLRAPWVAPASGWIGRTVDNKVYFLGWWQPAGGGAVRGVELNLPAVLERVQALVPTRTAEGARFAIRGPGEPLKGVAVQIPLATTLPGWTLVAWPGAPVKIESLDVGGGFFVVAALLVGAFVVSILAGGAIFFRQAAAAAREATLKTSFVSNVSHEMKTPLTTIRMYAEMLADERVDDPAKRSRYFATIGRETARLTRLVNNALDFGRLEAGRKEYHPETIPLGPWFARLVETYAPRATESGVRLVATPPATGAAVRCDPDSLDQIALNLIDNGLKYGAAGGVLELHADTVAGGWAVVVADRGPGVPAAHRERIFDRFHRVDDALTATKQGAGLGLTIARRLARDQGGDLVCRAREDGGAAFVLTLPVADDGGAPQRETK